jgi:hypothetical protein
VGVRPQARQSKVAEGMVMEVAEIIAEGVLGSPDFPKKEVAG